MLPVKTEHSNVIYDVTGDDEILPVPAHQMVDEDGDPFTVISLQLSKEDLEDLNKGNLLHVLFMGRSIIPFKVLTEDIYQIKE